MSMASAESSTPEETINKNGEEEEEEEEEEDDLKKEKKKLKKLRSIKLLRSPSLKQQRRKLKSQPRFNTLLSSSASSCYSSSSSSWASKQSSPTSASDSVSSPNYMKPTTCSDARKENFQKLAAKSCGRLSSKSVKSSKFKTQTEMKKFSSRIGDFESGLNPNVSVSSDGKSISPAQRLGFVLQRKPSLKPVRKLTKTATFKSKKSSMVNNLERATCSSAMKDSKFPSCVHLQPGKDEAEKIASIKVCPYSYCSLHGHSHGNVAPLKRFVSMRRRVLKTQLSKKFDSQAGTRSNRKREGNKPPKMVVNNCSLEARKFAVVESEIFRPDFPIDEANQIEERNRKYIKKWHLVYKNVLREIVEKEGNELSLNGKEKEEEEQLPEIPNLALSSYVSPVENSDGSEVKVELLKIKAIELVHEALTGILLPEIQDALPVAAKTTSATESNEDSERKSINDDSMAAMKETRGSSMVGNKSNKWSNLKKIILLKRFVKALDKVRNIDLRKPKYLSMEANPEAEKVCLKHKTQRKKNTEEWFLDFALRRVVSNLEPAQKRRVTMLVEAFESVIPAGSMNSPQAEKYKIRDGISFGKISDIKSVYYEEQSNEVIQRKNEITGKETREKEISGCKVDGAGGNENVEDRESTYREVPVNGKVLKVPKEIISRLSLELGKGNSGTAGKDMENSTPISSTQKVFESFISEPTEEPKAAMAEQNGEIGYGDCNDLANEVKLDKRKNTGLWFLIYKHMVSTIAADEETVPLVVGGSETENVKILPEIETSAGQKGDENGGENKNDESGNGQNVELHSMEAIRLVEEAIDQILLPEQDSKLISSIDAEQISPSKESEGTGSEKSAARTLESNKSTSQGMKNWNNLRRIMIMKRFIKAVEKVKKFNPRGPRFLPLTADEEAEKVHLRHQNTEDRKNAEEWMLDYALQQAVAKLTPARKRRVALLVEAFETVGPNMGR